MVIALAGRRIDAPGASPASFPEENVPLVRSRVRSFLEHHRVTTVAASAACGADLIALEEAGRLGIRRRVVLGTDRRRFRETSVTDRPGQWGVVYDRIIREVDSRGDLIVLAERSHTADYGAVNRRVCDEAMQISRASGEAVAAVVVWDGRARESRDWTEDFRAAAQERDLDVLELYTLGSAEGP